MVTVLIINLDCFMSSLGILIPSFLISFQYLDLDFWIIDMRFFNVKGIHHANTGSCSILLATE